MWNKGDKNVKMHLFIILVIWMIVCMGLSGLLFFGTNTIGASDIENIGINTRGQTIISTDTTWTISNSPYVVEGNVLVNQNVNLTIQPGVIIKFDEDIYLRVDGTLYAVGTESQMITFTSNNKSPAPGDWGGLRFESTSVNSILKYCIIEYGDGTNGGGINNAAKDLKISYCRIENNYANEGGGIFNSGAITLVYSEILGNSVYASGAGISNTGSLDIIHNTFSNNYAGASGGGIMITDGSVTIINSIFFNNSAGEVGGGGAIYSGGSVIMSSNIVSNNTAWAGGGVLTNDDGSVIVSNTIISNNSAKRGGGIYNLGSTKIVYSTISGNLATEYGGGISSESSNLLNIKNSNINNSNYNIYLTSSLNVNAQNNWWGTANTDLIDQTIYDFFDNFDLGKVIYNPFQTYPVDISNHLPVANAGSDQIVKVNQTVYFDGSGSYDSEEIPLTYRWDFGDGTTTGWQSDCNASHNYNFEGNYTVILEINDGEFINSDNCKVNVISEDDGIELPADEDDDNGTPGFEVFFLMAGIFVTMLIRKEYFKRKPS